MADETQYSELNREQATQAHAGLTNNSDSHESVTLKPEAIKKTETDEDPEKRKERLNLSDVPYHNYETEKIAQSAADEQNHAERKAYEFFANGYTVEEVELAETEGVKTYMVTADGGFEKGFATARDAEFYAETHAPYIARTTPDPVGKADPSKETDPATTVAV